MPEPSGHNCMNLLKKIPKLWDPECRNAGRHRSTYASSFCTLQQMASIRVWHTYLGILIAPSVLFFALTGALQIFSLHEAHGRYEPPALLEKMSSLHKDQVLEPKAHEDHAARDSDAGANPPAAAQPAESPPLRTTVLKWFFLLVALGLIVSTFLGLWMGLTHITRKRTGWWLLAVGIAAPVVLVVV